MGHAAAFDSGVARFCRQRLCTPRLTAMERIDGVKVTDSQLTAGARRSLARTVVAALLAKPFWSAAADCPVFHADPHAGNLFARVTSPNGLRAAVGTAVGDVRRGTFPGFAWFTPLLDHLARSGAVAFPESTALFRKSLLTLGGVVRDIWPAAVLDDVLIASGGRQFAAESWMRGIVPLPARRSARIFRMLICCARRLRCAPSHRA